MVLAALVSCQREQYSDNPNYNPNNQEVATDFVFNVSAGSTQATKMTAANTQADITQAFRGIDNAVLMSAKLASDGKTVATAQTVDKYYSMGTILAAGAIDPDNTEGTTPKSRRVVELSLPTGTNTLLFWGKALKTGTDDQQGKVEWTINKNKNLSDISFTLARRIPAGTGEGSEQAFKNYQGLLAAAMNHVVQTSFTGSVTFAGATTPGVTQTWKGYTKIEGEGAGATIELLDDDPAKAGEPMSALGMILGESFQRLNTFYTGDVRAGSAFAVQHMLSDTYETLASVAGSIPTSYCEAVARLVANQIRTNISHILDVTSSYAWKSSSTIAAAISYEGSMDDVAEDDLDEFPGNFHVPEGAATLEYDLATNSYSYAQTIPTYAMDGTAGGMFNIYNYRYPAELCYFGNSPIRVTSDTHITSEYPDGVDTWENDESWKTTYQAGHNSVDWIKDGHVLSSTRSVAMRDCINYGTAILRTTVRYGTAYLQDNNKAIQLARKGATEDNKTIDATKSPFELTGILIGGVEETMGWNYIAKAATPTFSSFIYESDIPSHSIPAYGSSEPLSDPTYTLVWDNWNPVNINAKQNVVNVALEFKNNSGKDFWGMTNIIRDGATFYIAGRMDPNGGTRYTTEDAEHLAEGITWPTHYALPPYDAEGNTIKQRRVFVQDHITKAEFVIGEKSLQAAMVSVPDLRSTQISLGLAVNLEWLDGMDYTGTNAIPLGD